MKYQSTRDIHTKITSAQAITQGISPEGGLYVPKELPVITLDDIEGLADMSYTDRACEILSLFLTDFPDDELVNCVNNAYTEEKFESDDITEISRVGENRYFLELWHGPTCAFKDMALQLLPYLLTASAKIVNNNKEICILVATSGDTGKAALEGFKDVDGTRIVVFYPADGVSPMQKRQMTTQAGENVQVCAINGNFDDAQTAVKSIFTDKELGEKLKKGNKMFSSANSINWGRLLPQIVYYVSAYCDLLKDDEIELGDKVNVCVPTGNFGNILAAYYAKKMGVPINMLICASNKNNVLTDFINTGKYDKKREFYTTISPSMDILISSNLERLIFDLYDSSASEVIKLYDSLSKTGEFTVSESVKEKLNNQFYGGCCDDEQTKAAIKEAFEEYGYLMDTHTAVAAKVYEDYKNKTGDNTPVIIASTANPYKFTASVLSAIETPESDDEFEQINELINASGQQPPKQLMKLKNAKQRFNMLIEKDKIKSTVEEMLSL